MNESQRVRFSLTDTLQTPRYRQEIAIRMTIATIVHANPTRNAPP